MNSLASHHAATSPTEHGCCCDPTSGHPIGAGFFSLNELRLLGVLAAFGLIVPNGVFVYALLREPESVRIALTNPVCGVFIFEAFFLMFLFAWLIRKAGPTTTTAPGFMLMSLVGSMAFSVPATFFLAARNAVKRKRAGITLES